MCIRDSLEEINKTMNLIRYEPGRFYLETIEVRERERPPMITIPEYRQKRGLPPMEGEEDPMGTTARRTNTGGVS